MKLRPYQRKAIAAAFREWKRVRSTLFVCPTGGGKSLVFSRVAERFRPQGRTLILADRTLLVDQAWKNIEKHTPLTAGIERGDERVDRKILPDVVCAMVQSLHRRLADFAPDAFGLIVVDEADLSAAKSYRKILGYFSGAKVLGVTATPDRADEQPLGDIFDSVCLSVDIGDLIRDGYLAPIRQRVVKVLDLSLATVRDGDFTDASLERILIEEKHLHEVVKPTLDLCKGRPTLVFATSVRHAEALAGVFNRYGGPGTARSVHGESDAKGKARNRDTIAAFERGEFPILCNCALLLRGVDIPPVAAIAMARPTQSRGLYTQALGRGTRTCDGKTDLLVLDFGDNAGTHSLVSALDILGGKSSEETKERAREIIEAEPGADVLDSLVLAEDQLAADGELRARVIAAVKYRTTAVMLDYDWTALGIGKRPDARIAAEIGKPIHFIRGARQRMGIMAFGRNRGASTDWDAEISTGGTAEEIAARLGVAVNTVNHHRARLGLTKKQALDEEYWRSLPLGLESDATIASREERDVQAVRYARRKFGILSVAATERTSARFADVNWSMSNAAIGRQIGLSDGTVAYHRIRRGLPPSSYVGPSKLTAQQRAELAATAKSGTTLVDLASRYQVSVSTVRSVISSSR